MPHRLSVYLRGSIEASRGLGGRGAACIGYEVGADHTAVNDRD